MVARFFRWWVSLLVVVAGFFVFWVVKDAGLLVGGHCHWVVFCIGLGLS